MTDEAGFGSDYSYRTFYAFTDEQVADLIFGKGMGRNGSASKRELAKLAKTLEADADKILIWQSGYTPPGTDAQGNVTNPCSETGVTFLKFNFNTHQMLVRGAFYDPNFLPFPAILNVGDSEEDAVVGVPTQRDFSPKYAALRPYGAGTLYNSEDDVLKSMQCPAELSR